MDDEAALLARRVAIAASAWMHAPADAEAYKRLVQATSAWDSYVQPPLESGVPVEELLDHSADESPPVVLGDSLPELGVALRRAARREL